jgi:hypothetical protein
MDKKEHKRLEDLQKDGQKEISSFLLEKLTYPDLQLLLCADPTIQQLIRLIIEPMFAAPENEETELAEGSEANATLKSIKGKSKPSAFASEHTSTSETRTYPRLPAIALDNVIEKIPYKVLAEIPVVDPLRAELAPELTLLNTVKADAELAESWLWAQESEGRQLVRLLAMLSEWDEVLSLWGRLADRCKSGQRAATQSELVILRAALDLHNLHWRDRAAKLVMAEVGASFHHETMERGSIKGSTVAEVWLPGLDNAAGQVQKKPVVKTK